MRGFKTSKVLIVDDDEVDAVGLARAFWQAGVGVACYSGEKAKLPEGGFSGIRLAAIDMKIGDDPRPPAVAVSAVRDAINERNGPYAAIAWTNNPQYVDEFKAMLYKASPKHGPVFMTLLTKQEAKTDDAFDIEKITNKVDSCLEQSKPLDVILDWEKRVHDAAVATTCSLSQVALDACAEKEYEGKSKDTPGAKWQKSISSVLGALFHESYGEKPADWLCVIRHASLALHSLVYDQIEAQCVDCDPHLESSANMILSSIGNKTWGIDFWTQFAGSINGLLHCDRTPSQEVCPGSVYCYEQLKEHLPENTADYGECYYADMMCFDTFKKDYSGRPFPVGQPVLVEVTPWCDYVQGKARIAHLVGGLLVPSSSVVDVKHDTEYMKCIGPLSYSRNEPAVGDLWLVLNSHFVLGYWPSLMRTVKPVFRLRLDLLREIQAWLSGHINRPGHLMLCGSLPQSGSSSKPKQKATKTQSK